MGSVKKNVGWFLLFPLVIFFAVACTEKGEDSLTRIREAGEIRFAMSGDYPPFNFKKAGAGLAGFDVDVARVVAERLDIKVKLIVAPWDKIIDGLISGSYDAILGSMAITEERKKKVAFSIPYYHSSVQLMVRKGASFKSVSDLRGLKIGVGSGSNYINDAKTLGAGEIQLFDQGIQSFFGLQRGSVDGIITDQILGLNAVKLTKLDIDFFGSPIRSEEVGVAFRKEDNRLLEEVNKILGKMLKDGTLNQLVKKMAQGEYDCAEVFMQFE